MRRYTAQDIADRLQARRSGGGWMARCPAHDDKRPSLRIDDGDDGKVLMKCYAGCSFEEICAAMGIRPEQLFPVNNASVRSRRKTKKPKRAPAPTYVYRDEYGQALFGVIRTADKQFLQVRPDGKGGWWYGLDGISPTIYRLPEVLQAVETGAAIYVVEGEKDADNLAALGLAATTNPMGAGKWRDEYSRHLTGANVILLGDNDEPGRKHVMTVAKSIHNVVASVKLLELRDLPKGGDVSDWLEAGGTREELERLAAQAPEWEPPAEPDEEPTVPMRSGPYLVSGGVICREKNTQEGPVVLPLCNFTARIVADVTRDDGAERESIFTIEGTLQDGTPLPVAEVPAERFPAMSWPVSEWGSRAVVYAGHGNKDHLRAAIQLLSPDAERYTVYAHLGWREIGGRWVYLHSGGGIGIDGPEPATRVDLGSGRLAEYQLPEPSGGDVAEAVRASLAILGVAPLRITVPLLAGVYRAPLGEAVPIDFSLHLVGPTGTKKSSTAGVVQAHWGAAFRHDNLPGHWAGTANALERLAFQAKDALMVIDDFAPTGSTYDVQRAHREADRLLRSAGNRGGRPRMRADGTLRPEMYPRGLILSTGEDIPSGQSLRARFLTLEVSPEDVDLDKLTQAQRAAGAGLLALAMSGYVRWLAGKMDDLKESLPMRQLEFRDHIRQTVETHHDRTPDLMAHLATGWEMFLQFALDAGAIDLAEANGLWTEGWAALLEAADQQGQHQTTEDPTTRFLALLEAALLSGRAHLVDSSSGDEPSEPREWGWRREGDRWQAQGERIGWVADEGIWLQPDAAFGLAQKIARDQGTSLPITQRTLWRRLAEAGYSHIERTGSESRYVVRRLTEGRRRRVVALLTKKFAPPTIQNRSNRSRETPNPCPVWVLGAKMRDRSEKLPVPTGPGQHETGPKPVPRDRSRKLPVPKTSPQTRMNQGSGPKGPKGPVYKHRGTFSLGAEPGTEIIDVVAAAGDSDEAPPGREVFRI